MQCETLISAKQPINDKLQGNVATYLRCSEVFNNQIKKVLLLSFFRWKKIKIGEYLVKLQAITWLSRALSLSFSSVLARRTKFTSYHALDCNVKKVRFSHTRYQALGPELIPVYRQSARRWREVNHAIYPAVVCRSFLPGLRLPS